MQRKPTLLNTTLGENTATLTLKVDASLEDFKGHFPVFALLPGVTQIDLAMRYARDTLGVNGTFGGMDVIKFQEPILPDATVDLTLTWHPDKEKLHFSYQSGTTAHSSGRVTLRQAQ
ncbi:ApeI family dehydratase [Enterovibrio norvegicus]|uniref:3-hydroxyacyl-ACP dehydratase n=1 Tax=Enterovibrio norvegicus TaxID=188144 RepID=A0A2N7LC47_9GAMM|nr:3-hydroxyacyl-ACP dehydratase [Enterovibrio norvegicus]PMN92898.1 3-hydroxyacyl-ACP dehydratase [Enterovibrio norvegicus]